MAYFTSLIFLPIRPNLSCAGFNPGVSSKYPSYGDTLKYQISQLQICNYEYIIITMIFEWDERKNQSNISKHGIAFEDARFAFADRFAITRVDHSEQEPRWQIMGHIGSVLLVLAVYTQRTDDNEEIIRIISARKATSGEKRKYEKGTWI